jgi:hypothetical protein
MNLNEAHLKIKLNDFHKLQRLDIEDLITLRDGGRVEGRDPEDYKHVTQDEFNLWIGRKLVMNNKIWDQSKKSHFEALYLELEEAHMNYEHFFKIYKEGNYQITTEDDVQRMRRNDDTPF